MPRVSPPATARTRAIEPEEQRDREGLAQDLGHRPGLVHERVAEVAPDGLAHEDGELLPEGLVEPVVGGQGLLAPPGDRGLAPSATGSRGLPGVACMTRNVTSAMARRVGISQSSRETTYWNNQSPPVAAPRPGRGRVCLLFGKRWGSQGVNGVVDSGPAATAQTHRTACGSGGPGGRPQADDGGRAAAQGGPGAQRALAALGAVPQRAPVGHGPRGLQPRRHRLGLLPPRPRPLARLSLGRGRPRRHLATTTQRLCFALALWNGRDPILKERLFGLTGNEGNHGEDVKEYYFYLDSTPTHSYMKCALQVPAGGVSLRAAGRGEPPARPDASPSSSCSTPASSTTTATSTSSSSTPRPTPTTS